MANKQINARIITKHDTEANWSKAVTFVPREGEIVIYEPDNFNTVSRFKVGDGKTVLNNLPFITDPFVKKELGKGLSSNDFTDEDKQKVANIPENYQYIRDGRAVIDIETHFDKEEAALEGKEPRLTVVFNAGETDANFTTEIPIANMVASVIESGDISNLGSFKILDMPINIPLGSLGYLDEEREIASGYMVENTDASGVSQQKFSDPIVTDKTKVLINQELGNIFWLSYEDENIYNEQGEVSGVVRNAIYNPILPNGYNTNFAELRAVTDTNLVAGKIVREDGSGKLTLASDLSPLSYAITDTSAIVFSRTIASNEYPVALKGRTLVYCEDRELITNANIGQAVCASNNGNVRLMTSDEKINYPESIVGYICEVPTYLNYGRKQEIIVDNRIWIKI